eukprot:66577_1
MAVNNKYILLFGGYEDDGMGFYMDMLAGIFGGMSGIGNTSDSIYVYSMKHKTVKLSEMKCPSKSVFKCVTVNDNNKDEKLIYGYLRNQWIICDINEQYFPPHYLIKLIHSYYLNEFVYLLDLHDKKHYKMSTSNIVQSLIWSTFNILSLH